jgi:HK97 family phage portal protein
MLERLRQRAARALIRNAGIGSSRELQEYLFGRPQIETEAGITVTSDDSMRLSSVYACVRVLSEDIAKLPLNLYQRIPNGKQEVLDHWLIDLLDRPNPWQTGFEFREMQQAHLELNGNFFALKTVVGNQVRELLPVSPQRIEVKLLPTWQLEYKITMPDGRKEVVPNFLMYHMRSLSLDGVMGLSPIGYQRETVALGISLRKFGNKLFKNGAVFSGVLQHPGQMEEDAWNRLKSSFEQNYAGMDNAHKMLLLEEGTTFQQTGMSGKDAQFLDARKYSRTEIAAIYRVPLHLIGDLERATFSNIEQQGREYVQNGLLGRVIRLEKRMMMDLLSPAERKQFFIEHLIDVLQRGDYESRTRGYNAAITGGWMTRNEVRALENMNPGPAELDVFMVPANMTSADDLGVKSDPNVPNEDPQPDETGDPADPTQEDMNNRRRLRLTRRQQ